MTAFVPPPPVVDNWRDHTTLGATCACGHPLWAPSSRETGMCCQCRGVDNATMFYAGDPWLTEPIG